MNYRAVFISDLHIGSSHCNMAKLLEFLRQHEFEHIFLVGDIIDGWLLKGRWRWNEQANLFVQKILRRHRHGTKVSYVYGNHDDFMAQFEGYEFGGILIQREITYESGGRRYAILHGDQFDGAVRFCPKLQLLGSWIYETSIFINYLLRRLGIQWSLSSYLKQKAKHAVKFLSSYRDTVVNYAKLKQVDGIILGHIHNPEITDFNGIQYMNIGDMVESNTILLESTPGVFKIVKL